MSIKDDWPDVWSEYRQFFEYFALGEKKARAVVTLVAEGMAESDIDRVADALKEFSIRAQERGVPVSGLRAELAKIKGSLEPTLGGMTVAQRHFGTAAEDLGITALRTLAALVVPRERERY